MAKRRKKYKKQEKPFRYGVELNGLLLILISIMGIWSFGAGIFIQYFAKFLMGDYSIILLVTFLILGIYMVGKRSLPDFFTSKKIGLYIIIIALLTFSHVNLISNYGWAMDNLFESTLNNFKDAISNIGVSISVGGGFIGALFSWTLVSLFTVKGAKITIIILSIFGVIMLFDIVIGDFFHKIGEKIANYKNKPKKEKKEKIKRVAKIDKVNITSVNDLNKNQSSENKNQEEQIFMAKVNHDGQYVLPPTSIFDDLPLGRKSDSTDFLKNNRIVIERVLEDFQLYGKVVNIHEGPAVTQYEVELKPGTKLSRVVGISKEFALALAAKEVRIMAPIPGKSTVGIEIPNRVIRPVPIREVLENIPKIMENSNILVALGKDLMGNVIMADLTRMPHLLVAGSTGSGKSVCINSFIASILMRYTDEQVKLVLVDPKKVELSNYKEIPHLLYPVVTDPKRANIILKKLVEEMEDRYTIFSEKECKNIGTYNEYLLKEQKKHPNENIELLPYIVCIIDELADLMLVAAKEVEDSIMRITQMARAAGIHLIVATQRPSTDVITGIVKANIPSRLSFAVSSGIDSRTILDMQGAEKLLGKGDMLYLPMGENSPTRIQGAYISDDEIKRLVDFVTSYRKAEFDEKDLINTTKMEAIRDEEYEDPLYDEIVDFAIRSGTVSASSLQRKFRLGFNRAARIIDLLEERGIVGPLNGSKPREVLVKANNREEQ